MKKLLSVMLAVVMVLGIAVTAFAATRVSSAGVSYDDANYKGFIFDASGKKDVDGNLAEIKPGAGALQIGTTYTFEILDIPYFEGKAVGDSSTLYKYLKNGTSGYYDVRDGVDVVVYNGIVYVPYEASDLSHKLTKADVDGTNATQFSTKKVTWVIDEIEDFAKTYNSGIKYDVSINDGSTYVESVSVYKYLDELRLKIVTADKYYTGMKKFSFTVTATSALNKNVKVSTFVKEMGVGQAAADAEDGFDAWETPIFDTSGIEETEEVVITWLDDAEFEVTIDPNQKSLNLTYTNGAVDEIIDAFPNTDMDFYRWEDAPRFNRIGTLYLYSDKEDADDYYLYAINSDGTLRLIKDAWDDREEAFVITTRTLGQYVASADKLDIDAYNALVAKANASSSNAPTAPASSSNPENPYTGAYDFAGIAAVLALVSAGAIVVAKKR